MILRHAARLGAALGALSLLAVACSSTPSVEDYCAKLKARYDACPNGNSGPSADPALPDGGTPTRPAFNESRCQNEHRCLTSLYVADVTTNYLACASNTDCSVSTSKCDDDAIAAGPNTTEADTCAKKYAECKSGGKGFDDDVCVSVRIFNSDTLAKTMVCFDKPCDQIEDCLEATVKTIAGDDCDID